MDDIDIANDDNGNTDGVIASLENVSNSLFKWFSDIFIKVMSINSTY